MPFKKTCGNVTLQLSDPHPSWGRIEFGGKELHGMRVDDLRDLRYLIDRVLETTLAQHGA